MLETFSEWFSWVRNTIPKWVQLLITLIGIPSIISFFLWLANIVIWIVRLFTSKSEDKQSKPTILVVKFLALLRKVIKVIALCILKTVRFGLSYWRTLWFPEEVKWDIFYIKIWRKDSFLCWGLQDEFHRTIFRTTIIRDILKILLHLKKSFVK